MSSLELPVVDLACIRIATSLEVIPIGDNRPLKLILEFNLGSAAPLLNSQFYLDTCSRPTYPYTTSDSKGGDSQRSKR